MAASLPGVPQTDVATGCGYPRLHMRRWFGVRPELVQAQHTGYECCDCLVKLCKECAKQERAVTPEARAEAVSAMEAQSEVEVEEAFDRQEAARSELLMAERRPDRGTSVLTQDSPRMGC